MNSVEKQLSPNRGASKKGFLTASCVLSLIVIGDLCGQSFTELDLGFDASSHVSSLSVVDVDDDGKPDLFLIGWLAREGTNHPAMLGKNQGGGLFLWEPWKVAGDLVPPADWVNSTGAWLDYDRDGRLDLAVAAEGKLYLYRHDPDGFTPLPPLTRPGGFGALRWKDFNHDGQIDALNSSSLEVLRQEGELQFLPLTSPQAAGPYFSGWIDFDFDGKPDLLVGTSFYQQNANDFTLTTNGLENRFTKAAFDADADGDEDVIGFLSGSIIVSLNSGGGTFTQRTAGSSAYGEVMWADFNNDGFNDIFVDCRWPGTPLARCHLNDGAGGFPATNAVLSDQILGRLGVGDFDGDARLDLVSFGISYYAGPRLILNRMLVTNTPPSPPLSLTAIPQPDDHVLLTWTPPRDDQTPSKALTYEVRVGTTPGATDALAPSSHAVTGFRRLVESGAVGARTNLLVSHLAPGTYYWSVQAVDTAFAGSTWGAEGSFVVSKPELSFIAKTHTPGGVASRPIPFTVSSPHGPDRIMVTAVADDLELIPPDAIEILGSDAARSVIIKPTNGAGLTFIELTATDTNGFSDRLTFRLYVEAFTAEAIDTPFLGDWAGAGPSLWADLDGDGNLDLITHGKDPAKRVSVELFRNPGDGRLQATAKIAPDLSWDTVLVEDFDHDNVPDLLFSGFALGNSQEQWANLRVGQMARGRSDFALEPVEVGLTRPWGFQTGGGAFWLDLGNDGAADVILWGNTATNTFSYAHRTLAFPLTTGVGFQEPQQVLDYSPTSLVWADFNRDGRLDLFTTYRDQIGYPHTYFYVGTATGALAQVEAGLPEVAAPVSVTDLDNDGWPDLLLLTSVPRFFRNLGNDTFAEVTNNLPAWGWSTALWGDLDNDGLSDVVFPLGGSVFVFRHLGNGIFDPLASIFPEFSSVGVALADADADGDLDLMLGGELRYSGAQYLCRNNAVRTNAPPAAPAGLEVTREPTGLMLRWRAASDAETPSAALTYNVRLGTTPGGSEIVSALADPASGRRRVVGPANTGTALVLPLSYLPRGPLYWSVQAVDAGFAGGPFAAEQRYQTNPPTLSTISNLTVAPNLLSDPIPFTVSDAQTPVGSLRFTVVSLNEALLPARNVTVTVTESNTFLRLTPAAHQSGRADLVLTVTDADDEWVGVRFTVTVPEEFSLVQINLPPLNRGSVAWADADQDGDLDMLTSGFTGLPFVGGTGRTDLWRNDAGQMTTNSMMSFAEGGAGAVAWADVDRDGDLDLTLSGGTAVTRLFWQAGPGVFTAAPAHWFTGATRSALAWGDRDGDGDPELLLGGNLTTELISDSHTWIYNQQGPSSFARMTLLAPGLRDGTAEWIDLNNDGMNDLFLTGSKTWYPSEARTLLYLNINGVLTPVDSGLPDVSDSAVAFADFDLDGLPDIALSGRNGNTGLFHNDGNGQFSQASVNLPAYAYGGLAWGDYDGDGDPDLLISGVGPQDYRTELWFNDHGILRPSGNRFNGAAGRGVAFADFDRDGHLDLAIVGSPDDGYSPPRIPYFIGVFHCDLSGPTSRPPVPVALVATVSGCDVTLTWTMPTNAPHGLSYNVRVGTAPFSGNVLSAPADPLTGQLRVANRGNAGWSGQWRLRKLSTGLYYWSVQAVDPAYRGSPFAPEASFSLPPVTPAPPRFVTLANAAGAQFQFTASGEAGRYVLLEVSSNLQLWMHRATLRFDGRGKLSWTGERSANATFFRLRQP